MRLSFILFFVGMLQVAASVYSQNSRLTGSFNNMSVKEVLDEIENNTEFRFFYNENFIDLRKKVSIQANNSNINEFLDKLFASTDVSYRVLENNLIVITPKELLQQLKVRGKVTDAETGEALPGVNVVVEGTTTGTITGIDGTYEIEIPYSNAKLKFSFIGYEIQEIQVEGRSIIDVKLIPSLIKLDEVVVTALGIEKSKRSLTYSTEQVNVESLSSVRDPSLATSLTGKIAGVSILNSSGANGVGGSSRIVIRGNKSISSNNQPLIVVDGVPYSNSKGIVSTYASDREVDSFDGFSNLNPDDIESINILKGPAAAALYGSSANNGVIIVTTKKAKEGPPKVEFNSISTIDVPYLYPEFQNEYAQGVGGVYSATIDASSWGPKMEGQLVTDWTGKETILTPQPGNVKELFVNGYNFTNSLTYSAGTEKSTAYFSYSNTSARSVIVTDNLQRNNFNLRLLTELVPKVKMDFKITFFNQKMSNRIVSGDDYFSPMQNLIRMPRSIRSEDIRKYEYFTDEGIRKQNIWVPGGSVILNNPYWSIHRRIAPTSRTRVNAFSSIKYDFTSWLSIQGRISLEKIHDDAEEKIYWDALYINNGKGNYYTAFSKQQNITGDLMLTLNKVFENGIGINAMIGTEVQDGYSRSQYANTNGLTIENRFALNFGQANVTSDYEWGKQIQSIYGTAQLSYKNAVYLDFTERNDWNSTLPPPYLYSYPSIGISSVLTEIFNLPKFISFAKIRGSYAEVGNGASFASIFQTYTRSTDGPIGMISPLTTRVADKLVPERTKSLEFGSDIKLWNNRLGIDFTWYKMNTYNQLISITTPPTSGYSSGQINCGNIQNQGIEMMISGTIIQKNRFEWDTYLTFSKNRNKVVELYAGIDKYELSQPNLSLGSSYVIKGRPYGEIYGRGFVRDENNNIIVGSNGIPLITNEEDTYLGNYNYDWQSGFSNTFHFNNFHLNFLVDVNFGGIRLSATEAQMMNHGTSKTTLKGRDGFIFTGIKQDGTPNDIMINAEQYCVAVGGRDTEGIPIELYKHDATNSRLRELSFGYSVFFKSAQLVKSIRISITGRNLLYFYNGCKWFDPDITYDTSANGQGSENSFLPGTRTFGVNIKMTF